MRGLSGVFSLEEGDFNVKTEIIAGVTTFLATIVHY